MAKLKVRHQQIGVENIGEAQTFAFQLIEQIKPYYKNPLAISLWTDEKKMSIGCSFETYDEEPVIEITEQRPPLEIFGQSFGKPRKRTILEIRQSYSKEKVYLNSHLKLPKGMRKESEGATKIAEEFSYLMTDYGQFQKAEA